MQDLNGIHGDDFDLAPRARRVFPIAISVPNVYPSGKHFTGNYSTYLFRFDKQAC